MVILIAKNTNDDGPTFAVKVRTVYCLEGTAILSKRATFFDQFSFFVEFLVELDVTSTGCVALRCVVVRFVVCLVLRRLVHVLL